VRFPARAGHIPLDCTLLIPDSCNASIAILTGVPSGRNFQAAPGCSAIRVRRLNGATCRWRCVNVTDRHRFAPWHHPELIGHDSPLSV
jgi:hypothetical protein